MSNLTPPMELNSVGSIDPDYLPEDLQDLHHHLNERVKELQCLYGITELVEDSGDDIQKIFQGIVNLIPPSWQYPEITCARMTFAGQQYYTGKFSETKWKQSVDIKVGGKCCGTLEVFYLEKMPDSDEGPFLKEERALINAIAERTGRMAERILAQEELRQLHYNLGERVKELQCLYGIAQLIEKHGNDLASLFQGITNLVPPSWQFPEVTCARLTLSEDQYQTINFRKSDWTQSADIRIDGEIKGVLEVCYLEKMPDSDEGPFLKEERALIDAIVERVGRIAEHIMAEEKVRYAQEELKVERATLEESNTAMKVVLARIEDGKKDIKDTVIANVDKILMPTIYLLESEVPEGQKAYVQLVKQSLHEITSPLIDKLSRDYLNLTPVEIQICNMVRSGLTTKEISRIRHVSPATVRGQREGIRRKFGLVGKDVNLITFLQTYERKFSVA